MLMANRSTSEIGITMSQLLELALWFREREDEAVEIGGGGGNWRAR